ncbi:hypothetical protein [Sphingobacterium composti Ten et al. 2007 non Yoo et al. 2007]|uniref:hypothetical protein n=1 Tax=Sphingobacterium composti TaxID=363260 RepID=UPI00135A1118|nr:hypothetical protein [Sphingobacterium composti Ten et al. 2007 non Yoo et al. 2007]
MKIFITIFTTYILFSMSFVTNAQESIFEFEDELCQYRATYDSKLYTDIQLRDTYKLVQGYYNIYTDDELQLDDTYQIIKDEFTNFNIVKTNYFKTLKDSIGNFLAKTYEAKKIEFAARKGNTAILLNHYQYNPIIKYYSQALHKGGETLIQAYEKLIKERMELNSEPERVWNEFLKNSKSPNAQQLAFDYVMSFGWWNTVNHQLPHVNFDGRQFEEFKKLFIKVETLDCEEF